MQEPRDTSYEDASSIDPGLVMENSFIAKKLDIKGTLMHLK